ncbi:MAG: DNA glycosylase AlkZ-like family protein [Vicinamibacterales bacterium]
MALDVLNHRLRNQQLSHHAFQQPDDLVSWLGAVQAQDYAGAKWALGQRLDATADADVEAAFTEGRLLRTHVLRPTWHFVAPRDIRWILSK